LWSCPLLPGCRRHDYRASQQQETMNGPNLPLCCVPTQQRIARAPFVPIARRTHIVSLMRPWVRSIQLERMAMPRYDALAVQPGAVRGGEGNRSTPLIFCSRVAPIGHQKGTSHPPLRTAFHLLFSSCFHFDRSRRLSRNPRSQFSSDRRVTHLNRQEDSYQRPRSGDPLRRPAAG
jgi:hypothetical protein